MISGYRLKPAVLPTVNYYETNPAKRYYTIYSVEATNAAGDIVGRVSFDEVDGKLIPGHVFVEEGHRRKGVASAMYAKARAEWGKPVVPSAQRTADGQALWRGMVNKGVKLDGPSTAPRQAPRRGRR